MFALDKPLGLSAAQALAALRAADPALAGVRLGHAGRLDPMAEGLLTVLVGDETREVHRHRALPKTYEVDVLLGVATDSFDELGLVTAARDAVVDREALARACASLEGEHLQRYPPFSQARVGGVSLIALGRAGLDVERPTAPRTLYEVSLLGVGGTDVAAIARVASVEGDFRQAAIVARWRAVASALPAARLTVAALRVRCSAGTYMRALAHDLGAAVGAPGLAARIRRTAAGALTLDGARTLPARGGPCTVRG